jgi:gluconolactonase
LLTYDVQPDGSVKNRKNFAKYDLAEKTENGLVSGADGLCIDGQSNTYATTPAGIQVFNAKGGHLGNIQAPYDDPPQNCGFGGPDKQYLYIVGRGAILRIHTIVRGYQGRGK